MKYSLEQDVRDWEYYNGSKLYKDWRSGKWVTKEDLLIIEKERASVSFQIAKQLRKIRGKDEGFR